MDYRGLSVIGVWAGTVSISALFLNFRFTTDFIMAMVIFAIVLTVYIVRLRPAGSDEVGKLASQLETISGRLLVVEGKMDEMNKLMEE